MERTEPARPSLWRPSLFALTWQFCTVAGWALVVLCAARLSPGAESAMGAPFFMLAALVVLGELRPIVMTRLVGNPVSMSLAFVFATMYLWGFYPAALLMATAVGLGELLQRKPLYRLTFNVGQYVLSLGAAWLVMVLAGERPTPYDVNLESAASDLLWIVGTWVVYHLVNLAFVGGLAEDGGQTWWESFSEEFWFYTVAAFAVLALSPLVAIVAVAGPESWLFLPLLAVPLLAVQRAAEMSREREHQALHDPLTDLPNRALLADRIEQVLARSARQPGRVAVLFLDIDQFKVVNDGLGHARGDELLGQVAARLQAVVRPGDTLARFGGDEFVIVCDDIPDDRVGDIATRIADALRHPFALGGLPVSVSASIGIALSTVDSDADSLLRDADLAMYRAKDAGRDRAVLFDAGMHLEAANRLDLETGLRSAVDRGELRLYYQPVVRLDDGAPIGVEALLRWQHPQRGLLLPGDFIGVAEATGLIIPIGAWVLREALTQVQRWRRDLPDAADLWVSVNISGKQIDHPGLVGDVHRALELSAIPPPCVRLEVTESVVMGEADGTMPAASALRDLGVQLAIDDFGTGYSSLSHLKRLPVTTLKIDRSFVDGLGGDDPFDPPIADAIISMARALGLDVVAEGVETPAQLATLRGLGAKYAQGYLWSPPLPAAEIPAWLEARAAAARS
jgi:diguanylate cyclase (GGDEF)-like protein